MLLKSSASAADSRGVKVIVLMLLALLLTPAAARAAEVPAEYAPVVQAALIADEAYWATVPGLTSHCAGRPVVEVSDVELASVDFGAWAEYGGCRIELQADYFARIASYDTRGRGLALCGILNHEYGHAVYALTHDYTGDPLRVMTYEFHGSAAQCEAAFPKSQPTRQARIARRAHCRRVGHGHLRHKVCRGTAV